MRLARPVKKSSGFSATKRRAAVLACACCLAGLAGWVRLAYATTAVALYSKGFAVVAVDGRVNKIGPMIAGHESECKLYVADGKVAVAAGLAEEQDVGFDIRKILHIALTQSTPVPNAADLVEQQVRRQLPAALQAFEQHSPAAFQDRAHGSLQLLLVGTDSGGNVEVARRSTPYDPTRRVQSEDTTGAADRVGVALIGETGAIDLDLERLHNTNGWEGMDNPAELEKLARRFIALEVVDKPLKVGPPLSMVLVDGDGIHWVEPGACKE
jgi:hypothetical protein